MNVVAPVAILLVVLQFVGYVAVVVIGLTIWDRWFRLR
jgi:hypothetical protein